LGVEYVKETFKLVEENRKKFNLTGSVYFGDVGDKIYSANEDTYAHLILDYCGSLIKLKNQIKCVIENKIVLKNGFVMITLNKAIRASNSNELFKPISYKSNFKNTSCKSAKAIETYFKLSVGNDFVIREFYEYKDIGRSPMILIVLQRVK
jgi:hypothetical protein